MALIATIRSHLSMKISRHVPVFHHVNNATLLKWSSVMSLQYVIISMCRNGNTPNMELSDVTTLLDQLIINWTSKYGAGHLQVWRCSTLSHRVTNLDQLIINWISKYGVRHTHMELPTRTNLHHQLDIPIYGASNSDQPIINQTSKYGAVLTLL